MLRNLAAQLAVAARATRTRTCPAPLRGIPQTLQQPHELTTSITSHPLHAHRGFAAAAGSTASPFSLEGRTALVTGGARDIGAACAVELARAGADVVVNYHASEAAAMETVAEIKSFGRRATAYKADVFTTAGIEELVAHSSEFFGRGVDILVCNAGGLNARGELPELSEEQIVQNVHMNYTSTALMCRALVPQMKANGFGRIILMGSIAGNNGGSGTTTPHYGPSKAAIACLGRSLTQAYSKHGVNVNTIAPGVIDTGFHKTHTSKENMDKMVARIAQGRAGLAHEVGTVAAFLAMPASNHICGDTIHVNGGMLFGS